VTDTLPSNTVTSTDLHLGGGGGTVANNTQRWRCRWRSP